MLHYAFRYDPLYLVYNFDIIRDHHGLLVVPHRPLDGSIYELQTVQHVLLRPVLGSESAATSQKGGGRIIGDHESLVESRLAASGPLITLSGLSLRLFVGIEAAVARLVAMARTAAATHALLLLNLPAANSLHCRVNVC